MARLARGLWLIHRSGCKVCQVLSITLLVLKGNAALAIRSCFEQRYNSNISPLGPFGEDIVSKHYRNPHYEMINVSRIPLKRKVVFLLNLAHDYLVNFTQTSNVSAKTWQIERRQKNHKVFYQICNIFAIYLHQNWFCMILCQIWGKWLLVYSI